MYHRKSSVKYANIAVELFSHIKTLALARRCQRTLARTVRRLDEHMGRLQRSLYNIQRKKKLYKENRFSISPPSEENKMTISPAIR